MLDLVPLLRLLAARERGCIRGPGRLLGVAVGLKGYACTFFSCFGDKFISSWVSVTYEESAMLQSKAYHVQQANRMPEGSGAALEPRRM